MAKKEVIYKNRMLSISMEEFVEIASDTMTEFEVNNEPENFEEFMELQSIMDNFAKYTAVLVYNLFEGD